MRYYILVDLEEAYAQGTLAITPKKLEIAFRMCSHLGAGHRRFASGMALYGPRERSVILPKQIDTEWTALSVQTADRTTESIRCDQQQ